MTDKPKGLFQRSTSVYSPARQAGRDNPLGGKDTSVLNASQHWTARHQNGENPAVHASSGKAAVRWSYDSRSTAAWIIPIAGVRGK